MATPTSRTLAYCKNQDWACGVVERFSPFSNTRHDLFGCIDMIALDDRPGVLGIQATSTPNVSARVKKSMDQKELLTFLMKGNRFQVWGWKGYRVKRKDGQWKKNKEWRLKRIEIILVNQKGWSQCVRKELKAREIIDG